MLLALAALALLQDAPLDKGEYVSLLFIDRDTNSGFQETQEKFITTLDDWIQLWARRQANLEKKRPRPAVDFDKDAVVVVSLGIKPSSGYTVEITRIVKTKEEIRIFLRKTSPPQGKGTLPSATSPFVLARMPKPDRLVRFYEDPKK